jgi:hypothetical protein
MPNVAPVVEVKNATASKLSLATRRASLMGTDRGNDQNLWISGGGVPSRMMVCEVTGI